MTEHRIALCGASGTGKTTLMKWLAERLALPTNPVGSRSVAASMGFANPYDVDKAGRRGEFQERLVKAKAAWEAAQPKFVTDRTTLDNLAYATLHNVHAITEDQLTLTVTGLQRYTHVVYCPLDAFCKLGEDPARIKDMTYHRLFDVVLSGMLQRYCADKVLTLNESGSPSRRKRLSQHLGLS